MMKIELFHLPAQDGADIEVQKFVPDTSKGTVVVCHGFGEHIDRYRPLAEMLAAHAYTCILFNQRGHGANSTFGVIPDYETFLTDLTAVANTAQKGVPLFLYGHSMGGNIAANYLLRGNQSGFAGAILESPWFDLCKPVPKPLVRLVSHLGDFTINNGLSIADITRDTQCIAEMESDPLYHSRISMRLFAGIQEAGQWALAHANRLCVPTFLCYAGADKIVSISAIQTFAANANITPKAYPDAYHALHSDWGKQVYFADMIQFLEENHV